MAKVALILKNWNGQEFGQDELAIFQQLVDRCPSEDVDTAKAELQAIGFDCD